MRVYTSTETPIFHSELNSLVHDEQYFLRRVEEKVKVVPRRRLNVEALPEQNPPEDKNQQYGQEC